ncbi:VanZ family protein [Lacticaseibacillus sp. GG6-2]
MVKIIRQNKWLLLALLVILTLFVSSSMTYREQTSIPFLQRYFPNQPGLHLLSKIHFQYAGEPVSVATSGYYAFVEFFMRKAAHVTTYFLIGVFGSLGLRAYVKPTWLRALLTVLSTCGLAALDEFHQMLTGDRQPTFDDVALDTIAALIGVVLVLVISALWHRKSHRGVVRR